MSGKGKEKSHVVRERIVKARKKQAERNGEGRLNHVLNAREVKEKVPLNFRPRTDIGRGCH